MKTRLLNALGFVFAAITGLCIIPNAANASAPFNDSFDSYSLGSLNGQGSWTASYSNVQTTYAKSGKAASCENTNCYGFKGGTETTIGSWYFWVKVDVPSGGAGYSNIIFYRNGSGGQFQVRFMADGSNIKICDATGADCVTGIDPAEWHYIAVDWNSTDYGFSVDWGDEIGNARTATNGGIHGMQFQNTNPNSSFWYIDEISDTPTAAPPPPVVAGFYPILTPTAPVSGTTNTVSFSNFDITGSISIPTDNTYIWQKLYATFTNTKGIDSVTKEIDLPDLAGGDSYTYSATSTIASATSTDVYAVNYSAWGYWCDPLSPEYCGKLSLSYPFEISPTYISEGSTPAGGIPPIVVSQWTPPTLEDCTVPTYSILEKFTCQIQNALLGLVIPSASSVNNLFAVFQSFQQKFPFSYVNEISSTFNTVRAALNESATISVKVFGQSGNISLAFWSTPATIAGVTTTIGATFKIIFTFFLLLIFLAWGIGYLHRIL